MYLLLKCLSGVCRRTLGLRTGSCDSPAVRVGINVIRSKATLYNFSVRPGLLASFYRLMSPRFGGKYSSTLMKTSK